MREAAQGGGEMAPPELVRTFYETVVSQHRLEDLPRFVGEGCVLRQGEWTTPLGPGGMVRHLAALRETYPDYTVRILRQHWAAPYVVSECVMEGTHLGPWPGTVPTGKRLIFTGVNIDRVEGGKIAEHGGGLSEGQAQRIAIARAVLRGAPILLLDEATSALDEKTEAQVLKNLLTALPDTACILTTHRPGALKYCTRLYKAENGALTCIEVNKPA